MPSLVFPIKIETDVARPKDSLHEWMVYGFKRLEVLTPTRTAGGDTVSLGGSMASNALGIGVLGSILIPKVTAAELPVVKDFLNTAEIFRAAAPIECRCTDVPGHDRDFYFVVTATPQLARVKTCNWYTLQINFREVAAP